MLSRMQCWRPRRCIYCLSIADNYIPDNVDTEVLRLLLSWSSKDRISSTWDKTFFYFLFFYFSFLWHLVSERTFCVTYDHTFYKQVQISRSDIRQHIKWAVSLVILHMVTSIFLRDLCGYIWANILTLSPRGDETRLPVHGTEVSTFSTFSKIPRWRHIGSFVFIKLRGVTDCAGGCLWKN